MKVSQMQSMLATNATLITSLSMQVGGRWFYYRGITMWGNEVQRKRYIHGTEKLVKSITRLSDIQRTLKDDIKAARTTQRVYKKHGPLDPDRAFRLDTPVVGVSL